MIGTRGNMDFHSIAYWNVALLILILYYDEFKFQIGKSTTNLNYIITMILITCFINPYVSAAYNYVFIEQPAISDWENLVIKNTHNGEEILIETTCFDSLYLLYKNRFPVNRLTYFMPWYMDWYEQSVINDLKNKSPNILIYYPDMEIFNNKNYSNDFNMEVQKKYTKIDENLFVYKKNK